MRRQDVVAVAVAVVAAAAAVVVAVIVVIPAARRRILILALQVIIEQCRSDPESETLTWYRQSERPSSSLN